MNQRFFVLVLLLLLGCGSNPSPTATPTTLPPEPTHTALPTAAVLPTVTLAPVLPTNEALLRIYPLRQGAQWVYREEAYDMIPNDALPERQERQITATLTVTDTVFETQTHGEFFAAQVVRVRSLITSSLDLNLLGEAQDNYFATNTRYTKWYILRRDRIVSQTEILDWDTLSDALLEYKIPFQIGECWYPEPATTFDCTGRDPQGTIPGFRVIEPLAPQRTPAGTFPRCYLIRDVYNGGNLLKRFCEGIGVIGEDFDHAGTPFGSHSQLIQFTPGE